MQVDWGDHPFWCSALAIGICLVGLGRIGSAEEPVVWPERVDLVHSQHYRQLLVTAPNDSHHPDRTALATYVSSDPDVAMVSTEGVVRATGPGEAEILVELDGVTRRIPVTVLPDSEEQPVDFGHDVVPILNKAGCNSGGCHGKSGGQNGFELSLFGTDSKRDFDRLTREGRGRRIDYAAPERSLLLRKAAGLVPHGGGRRIEAGSAEYAVLRQWVVQGTPPVSEESPRLTEINVTPSRRRFGQGGVQQLAVLAHYSDGSVRDVTRHAQYVGNNSAVVDVNETGQVTALDRSGSAAVVVRYSGKVDFFQAVIPSGTGTASFEFSGNNEIDEFIQTQWRDLGLMPTELSSDAEFLRRVHFDICGTPPTPEEIRSFLADPSPNKRAELIDALLDRPEYATYFAMKWASILRCGDRGMVPKAFFAWIREQFARNRPYDEFVRGVVAASGEWTDAPAINWYWQMKSDSLHAPVTDTAQVFLGLQLKCARCHHHPFERWSQQDYYGLAGFFMRVTRKGYGEQAPYYAARTVNPAMTRLVPEGQDVTPRLLGGEPLEISPNVDPRHVLVDWMSEPDNPYFAKALVNRYWAHFMGRGLVEPIDDLRETNPATHPELLDKLARDFTESGYDMKELIRAITNSQAYQLTSVPSPSNPDEDQYYTRYYGRRLPAEVVLDAVDRLTGVPTNFDGVERGGRAIEVVHVVHYRPWAYFLNVFGRPPRDSGCECTADVSANLSQGLHLLNSREIDQKLVSPTGRAAQLATDDRPDSEKIEQLYLLAFGRFPSRDEEEIAVEYITSQDDHKQAYQDLIWTLLNTQEFMFNH